MRRLIAPLLVTVLLSTPALGLVEPEVAEWQQVVEQARWSLPGAGGDLMAEAAEQVGNMGSEVAAAPLRDLMSELEERRGLKFRYFTPWHVKSKTAFRRYIRAQLDKEYTPKKIDEEESLLKVLGLVSLDFKVVPFTEDLLTDAVAGVYDTDDDQFFIIDLASDRTFTESLKSKALETLTGDATSTVIIHELDHALGGQYFKLVKDFEKNAKDLTMDEQMAVQALVEGDATFIMMDHQSKYAPALQGESLVLVGLDAAVDWVTKLPVTLPGMAKFNEAPLYYQRSAIFPYYTGGEFVSVLRHSVTDWYTQGRRPVWSFNGFDQFLAFVFQSKWSRVNEAYQLPPHSTAQIFHPYQFLYLPPWPNNPDMSGLPDPFGDWSKVVDQTGGEFLLRVVLEQYGVPNYKDAAEGWAGDKIRVFRNKKTGALGFYWAIRWTDSAEAREFYNSLASHLPFVVEQTEKMSFISLAFDPKQLAALRKSMRLPSPQRGGAGPGRSHLVPGKDEVG